MARWLLGLKIVATLAANVARGADAGLSVRRWPHGPVALVISCRDCRSGYPGSPVCMGRQAERVLLSGLRDVRGELELVDETLVRSSTSCPGRGDGLKYSRRPTQATRGFGVAHPWEHAAGQRAACGLTEPAIRLVPMFTQLGSWGLRHRPTSRALRVPPSCSNKAAPCSGESIASSMGEASTARYTVPTSGCERQAEGATRAEAGRGGCADPPERVLPE